MYAGCQSNNFFYQKIDKTGCFVQFKVSLQSCHNYLLLALRRGKTRVHYSNIFSASVVVPQFINEPSEIPEQLAVEKNS